MSTFTVTFGLPTSSAHGHAMLVATDVAVVTLFILHTTKFAFVALGLAMAF